MQLQILPTAKHRWSNKKIQLLLRLRVRELFAQSNVSLQQIMDDIGAKAEARGLTPEILETLLCDE